MKFIAMPHGAAAAALFLVAGCGSASSPDTTTARGAAEQAGVELAAARVPRPPAIPDDVSEDEAAPLNDAGEIASEISGNTMIAQVPVRGGLAWVEDGQVVRTASSDGRRVAYFHPGEDRPFFVQKVRVWPSPIRMASRSMPMTAKAGRRRSPRRPGPRPRGSPASPVSKGSWPSRHSLWRPATTEA